MPQVSPEELDHLEFQANRERQELLEQLVYQDLLGLLERRVRLAQVGQRDLLEQQVVLAQLAHWVRQVLEEQRAQLEQLEPSDLSEPLEYWVQLAIMD